MKIVIFDAGVYEPSAFASLSREHDVTTFDRSLHEDDIPSIRDAEVLSTFAYTPLDQSVLERFPQLQLIATQSTGYDHIDVGYCQAHSIAVANVPTYGERTVAEHAFALLLAISHRLEHALATTRSGRFDSSGLKGFDLAGRTIGIIGTGAIGRNAIRIAKGFGMMVLAYDVRRDEATANALGFEYVELDRLLANSDIISLHVPATVETFHLLSAAAFARMKPGVIIVNTARGSIIDEASLIEALRSGKVAAAGIDVLPDEAGFRRQEAAVTSPAPSPDAMRALAQNHVLCSMSNVVVTPHSAFYTREAVRRIATQTVENIRAFAREENLNLVCDNRDKKRRIELRSEQCGRQG